MERPNQTRCHNCQQPNHESRFCPEPPRFTRCSFCDRVCKGPQSHRVGCQNITFVSTAIQYGEIADNEELVRMFVNANTEFRVNGRWLDRPNRPFIIRPSGAAIYVDNHRRLIIEADRTQAIVANVRQTNADVMMTMLINGNDLTINGNVCMSETQTMVRETAPIFHDAPTITIGVRNIDPIQTFDIAYRNNIRYFVYDMRREGVVYTQFSLRRTLGEGERNTNVPIEMVAAPRANEQNITVAPINANAPLVEPPDMVANSGNADANANQMSQSIDPPNVMPMESDNARSNSENSVQPAPNGEQFGAGLPPHGIRFVPPQIALLPLPQFAGQGVEDQALDIDDTESESCVDVTPVPPRIDLT